MNSASLWTRAVHVELGSRSYEIGIGEGDVEAIRKKKYRVVLDCNHGSVPREVMQWLQLSAGLTVLDGTLGAGGSVGFVCARAFRGLIAQSMA